MVAKSKFKSFPGFTEGISKEGYIGLQDHGYPVWFRNINQSGKTRDQSHDGLNLC